MRPRLSNHPVAHAAREESPVVAAPARDGTSARTPGARTRGVEMLAAGVEESGPDAPPGPTDARQCQKTGSRSQCHRGGGTCNPGHRQASAAVERNRNGRWNFPCALRRHPGNDAEALSAANPQTREMLSMLEEVAKRLSKVLEANHAGFDSSAQAAVLHIRDAQSIRRDAVC